ncbi:MAG: helix-turn-helix domain-containing protein [Hyphomicrobiales bacterium]|nr:helix-turn-helix domain-containing protein [Hyphomicrobiales bacterium]
MRRWDRYAIRAELNRRGVTLTALALRYGLEPSACRTALLRPNARGEAAIAKTIGVPAATLWPDRYRQNPSTGTFSNAYLRRRASQKLHAAPDHGAAR